MKIHLKKSQKCLLILTLFGLLFIPFTINAQDVPKRKNGKYVEKYDRKHKKVSGRYKNYLKVGNWIYFSINKDTIGFETYSKGILNGRYFHKTYYQSVNGNFQNGKKTGAWQYHRVMPEKDSVCNYLNNDTLEFDYTVIKKRGFTTTEKGKIKNGKPDGNFIVMRGNLDKTGNEVKILEGNYVMGSKIGKWIGWNKNEKISSEREFRNDTLISSSHFEYYKQNLDRSIDSTLINTDPKSYFVKKTDWYAEDAKREEKFYRNREKDSTWSSWFRGGSLKSQKTYKYGKINGKEIEWFENGKLKRETNYVNGKKEGLEVSRDENGFVKDSGMYVNGKRNGKWIEFEKEYKKDPVSLEVTYTEGKRNGKFSSVYLAKTVSKEKPGSVHWEGTGKKRSLGTYKDNKKEGKYTEWYPSGKTKIICNYENGNYMGKYTEFDEDGKMIYMKEYKKPNVVNVQSEGEELLPPPMPMEASEVEKDYYDEAQVEVSAEFPGGYPEIMNFLTKKINYPVMEKESGVSGKVFISFIVNVNGQVEDVKVMKGVPGGPGLEKEAVRVVKMLEGWKPARHKGNVVRQRMVLPINFQLK